MEYINNLGRFGSVLGLERITELLEKLGNPQDELKFVHVAGTNGKGSTANLIAAGLTASGYKTGLFSSPYIERFSERIRIDNEEIPEEEIEKLEKEIQEIAEKMEVQPTQFEFVTALSLVYYLRQKVDIVVLEVGLGGRFDATNIIKTPELNVITSISKDHTQVLGNTLEKIAFEKAGTLKEESTLMLYSQNEEVENVIKEEAKKKNARVYISNNEEVEILKSNTNNQVFEMKDYLGNTHEVKIRIIGEYQCKNTALALNSLIALKNKGWEKIEEEAVLKGFLDARWPARFELISEKPMFILDGSHNPDGIANFVDNVEKLFSKEIDKTLVLGLLRDKDVDQIIKTLVPHFDRVVITLVDNERAMPVDELAFRVGMYCEDIICIEDIEDAVEYSLSIKVEAEEPKKQKGKGKQKKNKKEKPKKEKQRAIFATGSLYLAGDIRRYIRER